MPIKEGASDKTREKNIENEIKSGMDPKQAVGMAYSIQNKAKHRAPRVPWKGK